MKSQNKNLIKKHWNAINKNYSKSWQKGVKNVLSRPETDFISYYLKKNNSKRMLDIGSGNGRILQTLSDSSPKNSQIFGMDISEEMVKICKENLKKSSKIKEIKVCDASKVDKCFPGNFDFITSIRCIKYNKDWKEILTKIYSKLNKNGTFIFDISNKYSINGLYRTNVVYNRQTKQEIVKALIEIGFKINDMKSFSRIPDVMYELSDSRLYASFLKTFEILLSLILGKTLLGKVIFISVTK